ncbi:MAG: redox-sensing transcriptional repressor Rex [bacterium]
MLKKIPISTVSRLSLYLKCFTELHIESVEYVSSEDLAERIGLNAAQVRKDLAFFGQFGRRGVGYNIVSLKEEISKILGTHKSWKTAVIGMGNLGSALTMYTGFRAKGFNIVAGFDVSTDKIGWEIDTLKIYDYQDLEKVIKKEKIEIVIITTPKEVLADVMAKLRKTGIKGILNFAGKYMKNEGNIIIRNVDLGQEMEQLTFFLTNK